MADSAANAAAAMRHMQSVYGGSQIRVSLYTGSPGGNGGAGSGGYPAGGSVVSNGSGYTVGGYASGGGAGGSAWGGG